MVTREQELIKATRKYLEAKGIRSTAGKILGTILRDGAPLREITKHGDGNSAYMEFHARSAKKNLENIHPRTVVALKLALKHWENGEERRDRFVVEIPLEEVLLEEQKYTTANTRMGLEPSIAAIRELLGADIEHGFATVRLSLPAGRKDELKEEIEETIREYEKVFRRRSIKKQPVLEAALRTIGEDPQEKKPEELAESIKKLENAIYDRKTYEKLVDTLGKRDVELLQKMIDPRYLAPRHVAQLGRIAEEPPERDSIVVDPKELDKHLINIYDAGFTGGKSAGAAVPKHIRIVAGDAKQQDGKYIYMNVNPKLAKALLKYLARKNRKIARYVKLMEEEAKRKNERKNRRP